MRTTDWRGRDVAVLENGGRYYLREGIRTASVTTMIGKVYPQLYDGVASVTLEHARDRGIEVHRALALLAGARVNHTLDWASLDPEVEPRVRLIHGWLTENDWRPVYVERAFFSDVYGVGGTPDQVGSFGDDPGIHVLDFKPMNPAMADIQLAGYALCVISSLGLATPPRRISLNVSETKIQPVEYDRHHRDRAEFLNIVGSYYCGVRKGLWKVGQ